MQLSKRRACAFRHFFANGPAQVSSPTRWGFHGLGLENALRSRIAAAPFHARLGPEVGEHEIDAPQDHGGQ